MAKQAGIHGLRGKVNGMSYYGSKVGGSLVRKINEGMSARVKTGKEYANTRKNNSEFGMCGDFAGALIKPISLRWRFILDSIATGKMVKIMKESVKRAANGAWGQRVVPVTDYKFLLEALNSFSKNEMISEIVSAINSGLDYTSSNNKIVLGSNATLSTEKQAELIAAGVNHVDVKVFVLKTTAPKFSQETMEYSKAISTLDEIADFDKSVDLNTAAPVQLFGATETSYDASGFIDSTYFGGLLVVYLPGRKVGGVVNTLQEYCAAGFYEINDGD